MSGGIHPVLHVVASASAVVLGVVTSVSLVVESLGVIGRRKLKKVSPPCRICRSKGFYPCKLCRGNSTIEWSPLYDPIAINPCICPTCDGNRVQRCLNCLGKGYSL